MKRIKTFINNRVTWFKKLSRKKKLALIIVTIIIVLIIVRALTGSDKTDYNLEKVTRADIVEQVEESGIVKISGQTDIYSPTNGIIEELYVTNGTLVQTGDELFKVKSTATQQEQQAAYANYLTAQTSLNAAKSNLDLLQADMFAKWDSFKELAESDSYENGDGTPKYEQRALPEFHIPEKQWLSAEKKFKDQQQVIAQAQAAVSSTWLQYQATQTTVVEATANGTVSNLSATVSESVDASSGGTALVSTQTVRPILTIADYTVMGVLLALSETDINKIKAGNEAQIEVDPIDNKVYKGTVIRVDSIGHDVAGVTKYDVFIDIRDRDEHLKAGMSADALIVTNRIRDTLSVPNSAIRPYQGGKAVQIVKADGELEFVSVEVGIKGEDRTQILSGLSEGQEVVTALKNDQVERKGLFGN
ncbi:MAG: efflux RND transporter periplasmic adaptor subunit [Weeksellaceae bacterium]